MEVMTRTPRLLRIVSSFCPLLVTEDRFYRIINIKNMLVVEKFVENIFLVSRKPSVQFLFICGFEGSTYTILVDDSLKVK